MNEYSSVTSALASELATALSDKYSGLVVARRQFKPDNLPAFDRYAIIISPSVRPTEERITGVREVQYTVHVDLFLLVKNYDDEASVFGAPAWTHGDPPADQGVFQLMKDAKDYLRTTNLGGLLVKTYAEAGGDPKWGGGGSADFQEVATPGLSTGSYPLIQRIRLPFSGRLQPFCVARVSD